MTDSITTVNVELISRVEQFYYREARLLDERKYQQWLALTSDDICYKIPVRHTAFGDNSLRDTEAFLNVAQELSHGLEPAHREENKLNLSIRVMRAFKNNSWSDNPPARTRRFVSNVEVYTTETENLLRTYSNLLLNYSRFDNDNYQYSAQRQDTLKIEGDSFVLTSRLVLLDWNVITGPSLGLFF
ncbi:MAG: hypothetical protein KDI30_00915 [Pseudomonadales bacterium]|nr:hypothetical protein [Pseudomonadales bacterium]